MKIEHNFNLKNKTTFHIGGIAKNFYIPESPEDLLRLIEELDADRYYILSGGSNLLINDNKEYESVIYMSKADTSFINKKNGIFFIGNSLRIQEVINKINNCGYGGIEELYSLPAFFGGIIYMNAGIGSKSNSLFTISDFIIRVKVINIKNKKIEWIDKKNCCYGHRKSIFQEDNYIILGAECKFYEQNIEKSKKRIKERIRKTKEYDRGKGCFGTCFSQVNYKLLKITARLHNKKGNVRFGNNNKNWLVNDGNGTFKDAIFLINKCKKIHKLFHKKIECEVRIWE